MINMFIALQVVMGERETPLTEKEAASLAKKLSNSMMPHDFGSALTIMRGFFEEIDRGE